MAEHGLTVLGFFGMVLAAIAFAVVLGGGRRKQDEPSNRETAPRINPDEMRTVANAITTVGWHRPAAPVGQPTAIGPDPLDTVKHQLYAAARELERLSGLARVAAVARIEHSDDGEHWAPWNGMGELRRYVRSAILLPSGPEAVQVEADACP